MKLESTGDHLARQETNVSQPLLVDLADRSLVQRKEPITNSSNTEHILSFDEDIYKAKDSGSSRPPEVIAGIFPNDKAGDQLNYVRQKVGDIMNVDRFRDLTGASFGWYDKAARAESVMNDTANVPLHNSTERRSYLNTVAADFNRNYGHLSIAESRGLSEIHGHPHASVNQHNKIEVYLVDDNGRRAGFSKY